MELSVLLIEDNPADALLIRKMLSQSRLQGYRAVLATTLAQALAELDSSHYDIVLTDLGLPDSQGLNTVAALLRKAINLPIVVLTGDDSEYTGNESMKMGAQDYLVKGTLKADQLNRSIRYSYHRKMADLKLLESEKKFRAMVDTSPDAVTIAGPEGQIRYCSKRAAEIFGYYSTNEMLGINTLDLIAPEFRGKANLFFNETCRKGIVRDIEYLMIRKDGSQFFAEQSASYITNELGKSDGFIIVTKDISERKNSEKAIKSYQENLRSMASELNLAEEKERRRIAVDLHDNLGQSLALAKIKVAASKKHELPGDVSAALEDAEEHISYAIKSSRLLTYELSPPVLFEMGLVEAIKWKLEQISKANHVSTSIVVENELPVLNDDYRILLFRSVTELLNTVVKQTDIREIHVRINMLNKNLNIVVNDDGKGFRQEFLGLNHFDTKDAGLFSVKERLEYFEGKMNINSSGGKVTKIELSVPVI